MKLKVPQVANTVLTRSSNDCDELSGKLLTNESLKYGEE